jgi:phosphatidylglycerophosphatase A
VALNLATCGPLGHIPLFPGTVGSLVGVAINRLSETSLGEWSWVSVLAIGALALWACGEGERILGRTDPPQVILDEVLGMSLGLLGSEGRGIYLAVGFVVFRILDILKPRPINIVQRRFKGALAIVGDDLLAGLGTMILMRFLSGLEII